MKALFKYKNFSAKNFFTGTTVKGKNLYMKIFIDFLLIIFNANKKFFEKFFRKNFFEKFLDMGTPSLAKSRFFGCMEIPHACVRVRRCFLSTFSAKRSLIFECSLIIPPWRSRPVKLSQMRQNAVIRDFRIIMNGRSRNKRKLSPAPSDSPSNSSKRPNRPNYNNEDGTRRLPLRDRLDLSDTTLRDENPMDFFDILYREAQIFKKYQFLRCKTNFNIKNVSESKNPAGLLLHLFEKSYDLAIREGKKHFGNVTKIGVELTNPNLDYPVYLPFRSIAANSPMNLLREFSKIQQSASNGSLLDATSSLAITVVSAESARGRARKQM